MTKVFRIKYLIIAVIFFAVAVVGVFAAVTYGGDLVFTATAYGEGTEEEPYRIYNAAQLINLRNISTSDKAELTRGKRFVLMRDITIRQEVIPSGYGFCGELDGNGHTLTLPTGGIFYRLDAGGVIKNVNVDFALKEITKEGDYYGMVNKLEEGAVITDCTVRYDVTLDYSNTKEYRFPVRTMNLCGVCVTADGSINNVNVVGNVTKRDDTAILIKQYICGIAGSGSGTLTNCTNTGDINLQTGAYHTVVYGLSRATNTDCVYNGDITINCVYENGSAIALKSTRKFNRTRIVALGLRTDNCVYNGDIYVNYNNYYTAQNYSRIAFDGSTYTHNGTIAEENKNEP